MLDSAASGTSSVDEINEAYERMLKSDVKHRFIIDMETIKKYK
jgi:D-arabinose 1-dehydrogenase-like Zn-dependent alcohol dehydrogenase